MPTLSHCNNHDSGIISYATLFGGNILAKAGTDRALSRGRGNPMKNIQFMSLAQTNPNEARALILALVDLGGLKRTWCVRRIIRIRTRRNTTAKPANLWEVSRP